MAGQFAKPRSSDTETRGDVTLPAYRGDAVNDLAFTPESRRPDPHRLVRVYNTSAATLNLVRAFTQGGFADLRKVHDWNKGFVKDNPYATRYEAMATEIGRALDFMKSAGVDPDAFKTVEFFSSHEALILEYEKALILALEIHTTFLDISFGSANALANLMERMLNLLLRFEIQLV
jgi:3-deoxy-7-phosphoheptulonate synthase